MNNFKKYAEQEKLDVQTPPSRLKSKIKGAIGVFELAGNLVELFIPKVVNIFRDMLGAESKDETDQTALKHRFKDVKPPKYPNQPNH